MATIDEVLSDMLDNGHNVTVDNIEELVIAVAETVEVDESEAVRIASELIVQKAQDVAEALVAYAEAVTSGDVPEPVEDDGDDVDYEDVADDLA